MSAQQVLIAGKWQPSQATGTFQASNPKAATVIEDQFPVSSWADCQAALDAGQAAFAELRQMTPDRIAGFLETYAQRIEARSTEICEKAAEETAFPIKPRLAEVELPRTTGQLRKAAAAARSQSWCMPTIDSQLNIRSYYAAIGPVAVFGPNNFPFAFGSISGGDFAAAIAAGNPVLAKANTLHPGTTQLFAEEAQAAADETGIPAGTVQLIYRLAHADGERLARDPRLAAIGYTGSRHAGLKLKAAADFVGKPIYLELSSVNPVIILPGALAERGHSIAEEFTGSCLMGTGQFCTNPGLVVLIKGPTSEEFIQAVSKRFCEATPGTLLSGSGQASLSAAVETLIGAGAEIVCGGKSGGGEDYSYANTLLRVSGDVFLSDPETLQTEAFGNCSLLVMVSSIEQATQVISKLEGNLTGCVYSATDGSDDDAYGQIAAELRQRVGRLLNDKMPTGVAVSPAMNHGGPYPATGHPGFTAVGIPASLLRFAMLQCFDGVRPERLPEILKDENPAGVWRLVDGQWSQSSVGANLAAV